MKFKKLYKIYASLFVIGVIQVGCIKNVQAPLAILTEDVVYDKMDINGFYADQALTNLYSFLPQGFNRIGNSFLDDATDDGITSQQTSSIQTLSQALQSPTQLVDDAFASNYTGIYRANMFLSKVDVVPVDASIKQYDKAEARFLRAMFYFELIKRYGGVPLLGNQVLNLNSNLRIPRNTYAECVAYIVSECDAITSLLRTEAFVTTNSGLLGHATTGCALALKARTLLYAASPLNNPGNDLTKWQAAADAAKAVITLGSFALDPSFVAAFTNRADKEVILAFQQAKNATLETAQSPVGYTTDILTSNGLTSPTQELVDVFPTIKGLPITTDIKSAANATGYDATNPYANRDPRLNATIFYNGSQWLGRAVQTFEGGLDKPGGTLTQTKTGYYLRKFLPDLSTATAYATTDHNFIIFRYAEILLDYAEALNEVGGAANTAAAYTQLTTIRKRAGITAGTGSLYGLTANMSQVQMRSAVRQERRIEMAFEEQRFWDERRWNTAQVDFNKPLHGVTIIQSAKSTFSYQLKTVGAISFLAPKMYLYPISYSELQSDQALVQNQGW
jgi:hypothetical protein